MADRLVAFMAVGVAWLGAAALVVATAGGTYGARWLALHFAFVGGISQLILGAAQFFVCAFLATDPPARRMVRAQLAVWNAGTLLVAIGVRAQLTPLTGAGGTLLLAGLVLFAASLRAMERRSLQRVSWATRWYFAAALSLACGAALGPLIAAGAAWSRGSLLGAHIVLNLGGWVGTAIVGTVHTFYPSLTGTRLRHPRLQAPTFAAWTGGIASLAGGAAFDSQPAAVGGWALLLAATALLLANLAASARAAVRQPAPALLVGGAQLLLAAALVAGLVLTLGAGPVAAQLGEQRALVALLAVGGWIGLTVAGSLLHLLALMTRVRRPEAAPARPDDRASIAAALAVVVGLAVSLAARLLHLDPVAAPAGALVTLGYLGLGVSIVTLAVRAVRVAPLRL